MKRSPLKRKTELKRSTKPMQRSRLKPISQRTAKLKRDTTPARRAYVAEIAVCVCGDPASDCHEIAAGASREKALRNRFAWLALCRACHERWQGAFMPAQYAAKAMQDSAHYDRVGLNILRGKQAEAITEAEVIQAAYELGRRSMEEPK